ncbi:MAG: xylulokinase [Candidatus Bathyarchaeota archaeon]|nr:xylulokinase [Candidatus Bathyarchaeota archaeon]
MPEYFIGVDSGTQGTRAVVVDGETGRVAGKASKGYGLIEGLPPGHMEQHPSTWVEALVETMSTSLKDPGIDPKLVKGIGISGQQHGFVPLDVEGKVIRPAKLWNDTSTAEECGILIEALGGEESVIGLIGNSIPPGFTASKVLWLKRHEPRNYERLSTVLLPHDYLNFYLTGRASMEYGDASGTALMDVRSRRWSEDVIGAIDPGLVEKLPALHPSDDAAGNLRGDVARKLGLGEDVLVSAGGGDNMMAAIGTGNTRPGIVTVSLGTSGTIYAYSKSPVVDPKGEIAAFCDSTNGWLPLVCTMNVTVSTELIRALFDYSYQDLEDAVSRAPVGSGGLILLPYLHGERTPNVPDGTGVYFGLNEKTFIAENMARSAMEGVTLGLNYGFNRMRELGIEPSEIRLTGGGARNRAWRRIAADVFDAKVFTLKVEEGAAYGAALQAYWTYKKSMGEDISISKITDRFVEVDESSRIEPDPGNVEVYKRLQRLQDRLSSDLREAFRERVSP